MYRDFGVGPSPEERSRRKDTWRAEARREYRLRVEYQHSGEAGSPSRIPLAGVAIGIHSLSLNYHPEDRTLELIG